MTPENKIKKIRSVVLSHYGLTYDMIQSNSRKREIVEARQIAQYFAKESTPYSLFVIGKQMGNKDHATVLHSIKTVNNMIDTNKDYAKKIESMRDLLIFKGYTNAELLEKYDQRCMNTFAINDIF